MRDATRVALRAANLDDGVVAHSELALDLHSPSGMLIQPLFVAFTALAIGCVSEGPASSLDPDKQDELPPECDRIATPTNFVPGADGKTCQVSDQLCVSDDPVVCPALEIPSCPNGRLVDAVEIVPSDYGDGLWREYTRKHCVTADLAACPDVRPLPPSFCPPSQGNIRSEAHFIASTDGMECSRVKHFCVSHDLDGCPQ
jgi:hypothetical protein